MKKLTALILTILMILSTLGTVAAFAEEAKPVKVGVVIWSVDDGGLGYSVKKELEHVGEVLNVDFIFKGGSVDAESQIKDVENLIAAGVDGILFCPMVDTTIDQFGQYWNALKICQEMAQPRAMEMLFKNISKAERAAITEAEPSRRYRLEDMVVNQYIDMTRTYWAMPTALQQQLVDHSEETIVLLRAQLDDEEKRRRLDEPTVANHYMNIADFSFRLKRESDVYDALTEAQIILMRHLGDLQKKDGEGQMSTDQLITRLQLSVTNHMLADHYRRTESGNRELQVLLQSNLDMANDCFTHFPGDPRVIHFIINAALEIGDLHNRTHGYLTESKTYQDVITRLIPRLNNMQLDQQLAVDVAMLHSKAGQLQAGQLRDFKLAIPNLTLAAKIWTSLAENTKNEQFRKNAETINQILRKISPKGS